MSEVEIIGRAVLRPEIGIDPPPVEDPAANGLGKKLELSLVEAAALADRTVEELKRAIRAGELRAERRGR